MVLENPVQYGPEVNHIFLLQIQPAHIHRAGRGPVFRIVLFSAQSAGRQIIIPKSPDNVYAVGEGQNADHLFLVVRSFPGIPYNLRVLRLKYREKLLYGQKLSFLPRHRNDAHTAAGAGKHLLLLH